MGTGSKSSHASYAVGPTTASEADGVVAEAPAEPMSDEEVQAKADLLMAMNIMEEIADPPFAVDPEDEVPTDPVERYDLFVSQVELAQAAIEKLKEEGASDEEIEAHTKALKAQTLAYLNSLDDDDLREIAEAKGFEHPALVGLSGKGQHPLVHWLDPAYPGDIPSKAKIQAAALSRYNELLAGKTVGGMTLADLHDIEGTEPPLSGGAWKATPDEVASSAQAVTASIDAWNEAKKTYGPQSQEQRAEALRTMLAAEQKLASADCPELGEDLAKAKAEAKSAVDEALHHTYVQPKDIQPLVQEALASGQLSETEANHLGGHQLVALMRPSTPESEVESLKALAAKRQEQLANLDAGYTAHVAMAPGGDQPLNLPPAGDPGAPQAIAAWAKNAGDVRDMQTSVNGWYAYTQQGGASDTPYAEHPALGPGKYLHPGDLTGDFKSWAAKQKLSDLRAVAGELGMDNNAKATRAQVQNYIAASFNEKYDQQAIKDKVNADVAKKEAAKVAKAAAAAAPSTKPDGGLAPDEAVQALASKLPANGTGSVAKPAAPAVKPVKAPKPGSFNANVQAMMAAVQHAKATNQDLPARVDAKEVASWTFGAGTKASHLGGIHAKSIHAAPDGSPWMFKADHSHGGALGHTEAAASQILALSGVPSVPVYHHKTADGTAGSVQPLLQGAKPFTSSPSQWTQTQVDAIVRSHVGSWLISDHDGYQDNWLQTPSGGLVQIDHGQSYKFFGADQLSVGYDPNGVTPIHQKLYQAALSGGLGGGVKINPAAAHPVIKKFESMPDAQLRSVLHSTAYEGAKTGVAWVPQMRSRAAKALKIPQSQVTHDQIATAFLDHAVERKNNLRQNFSDFFVQQLGLPSGASLKHGGGS
ncbi:hypothetical protein ADK61_24135 [Streptomyces sp. XY66]|uniref:hypothetical protein n=1 Tax=Streptomyces sp. XY66 TaxID=1415563 RepID=UPI0006AE115A|nr:hypothetical protein [Streptomyces sp. XY66]KOU73182.1 hypothetical protein ADK61_24135 [Streptomyces sp. XY66]